MSTPPSSGISRVPESTARQLRTISLLTALVATFGLGAQLYLSYLNNQVIAGTLTTAEAAELADVLDGVGTTQTTAANVPTVPTVPRNRATTIKEWFGKRA